MHNSLSLKRFDEGKAGRKVKVLHGCVPPSNPVPSHPSTSNQIPISSWEPLTEVASSLAPQDFCKSTTEKGCSSTSSFQNQLLHSISSSDLETFAINAPILGFFR